MHTHTNARFIVVVGLPSFSVTDDEVFCLFSKGRTILLQTLTFAERTHFRSEYS